MRLRFPEYPCQHVGLVPPIVAVPWVVAGITPVSVARVPVAGSRAPVIAVVRFLMIVVPIGFPDDISGSTPECGSEKEVLACCFAAGERHCGTEHGTQGGSAQPRDGIRLWLGPQEFRRLPGGRGMDAWRR